MNTQQTNDVLKSIKNKTKEVQKWCLRILKANLNVFKSVPK